VRLPKEVYYGFRVAGNTQPDIHIVGHWTYPAGTTKTMYVVANTPRWSYSSMARPKESHRPRRMGTSSVSRASPGFGTIKAVGYDASGTQVCQHQLTTAGAAAAVKLTATTAPGGFLANGEDVAMFDVEVVDATGLRVPPTAPLPKQRTTNQLASPRLLSP